MKAGLYITSNWGNRVFPAKIDWEKIEREEPGYLCEVGRVGVDSASVKVEIKIHDIGTEFSCFTPEGDGLYRVLVGKIPGVGRCLLVCFEDEDDEP